jgi:2'-5' RNA ligase
MGVVRMSLGVVAYVEQDAASRLEALALNVGAPMTQPPHVTIAGYENHISERDIAGELASFVRDLRAVTVKISSIGVFGDEGHGFVVFLAPVCSDGLLTLHRAFHRQFDHLSDSCVEHYRPGNWVPHITVAANLDRAGVAPVVAGWIADWAPFRARLGSIALVEHPPARSLGVWRLANEHAGTGGATPAERP